MAKNIKEWREEERPREKMLAKGCESLTCSELIAILIRSGSLSRSAVELGGDILDMAGGRLEALSRLTCEQLLKIDGVGSAKALSVMAAMELGRRMACETPEPLPLISDAHTIASIMIPQLYGLRHEECWVLYLNSGGRLTGRERTSLGSSSATIFDIKAIVRKAVDRSAAGIVIVHNHPSGSPLPSRCDIDETAALRDAAALLDIKLLDHVIVSGNYYYSFSEGKNCYLRNNNLNNGKNESNQPR
ncbi:MAG: DNA repair protein RadC [Bacteroidales bacterium]|nr:DNA repair protein RadC [Bacteroidales bacterium]